MQQCSEQNAFRKSVHLSKTHFTLIQDRIFNLHRKALESSLSLINQKSSYGIKNPLKFNGDEKSFLHSDCGQLYSGIIFPESKEHISTQFQFLKHQRTHKIEKSLACVESEKPCSRKSQLISHESVHPGEKPSGGDPCEKSSKNITLTKHQKTQTQVTPHLTSEPRKSCTVKSSSPVHHQTCTGEKAYVCSECGKG